ncbi:MAG: GH36-type glycosyl hydrolase domain-containing protein [Phycisphaerae bacterium]
MKPTKYGTFSDDGKEFIISEPRLDRPWMNVLSNGAWCDVCSHIGGGYSFLGNPTVARITRWHIDGVPRDTVGKFVYLRDEETGEWWNANAYPPVKPLDDWKCHVGLGYNRIASRNKGIGAEITYFTPMPDAKTSTGSDVGDPCLLWTVKLTNHSDKKRTISATNYAELSLGNWFEDTSWREFYLLFNRQEYKDGVIFTRNTQWVKYLGGWQAANSDANNIPFDKAVVFASSADVTGYEGERYEFIGSYRDLADPQVMDSGTLRNKVGVGRDACSALQHKFELAPGESAEYVIILGAVPREAADATELTDKYGTVEQAKAAFENNQAYWAGVVESPMIETPDEDLNTMVNTWFKYQGSNLSWWNRNTGYCYSGIYNFGVRDACQDTVSRLPQDPTWVREHIVKRIMIWQFEGGDYAHGGNFVSMQGTRTFHSDDPLNPLFILANYVRETGDYSILEETTPWVDPETCISGRSSKPDASIYEHAIAGIEFFWSQFSDRGLPLILKADWNDALDQMGNQGKGESVMLAGWAIICIEMFYTCMEHMEDSERLAEYKEKIAKLRKTVNELCWDGDWYWRGTHDSGWVLGSKDNKSGGMIFTNPNAFAIVAGLADEDRTGKILASFDKYIDNPRGSYCFYPPFPEPENRAGIISRFAPGTKENGSLQGHNSRWRIWAEFTAGRGDTGYDVIKKMLPCTRHEQEPETYRIEPYIAPQFTYADESDNPGEGSHAWATGTACWTLLNVWEHMLGVRPEVDGLLIDPCLPADWTWSKMTRNFRGATYEISIEKAQGICKGELKVEVDGAAIDGNIIKPHGDGKTHEVKVTVS